MNSKQVLSIEQMQHLQELGLDTSNASAFWCNPDRHGDWSLEFTDSCGGEIPQSNEYDEFHPAYTLQDVLDALPKQIGVEYIYDLCIFPKEGISYTQFIGGEINDNLFEVPINGNLIDAAYEMLCWCIENGYAKIVKEDK